MPTCMRCGMANIKRLGFTHPGKMGDAMYSLPAMRYICRKLDTTCDFYTSEYCRPMKRLFEYQDFIDGFYMPDNYRIQRMDMGVQPWYIPVDLSLYETVWQLGFRQVPDRPLPNFIAMVAGIQASQPIVVKYNCPDFKTLDEPYIIISPRGRTTFEPLFQDIIDKSPVKVVQVGGWGDAVGDTSHENTIDQTGLDMLETCTWIKNSKGFIGIMSVNLVLANGFEIPRVSPHDGKSWDMRHVIRSEYNHYPINPTAEECLELIDDL